MIIFILLDILKILIIAFLSGDQSGDEVAAALRLELLCRSGL